MSADADARPVELDPVIHAQARLRLTTTLAALPPGDRIAFPRVQQLLDMTAGNLATHLRKLEDAGYVEVTKAHRGRSPVTYLALTRTGRHAYEDYLAALRALLEAAAPGGAETTDRPEGDAP
ncbi:transcriptional regulator [Jannaschia sp. R86511]|uniref:transcriptional regulator n=1 Tax=Jannaschia sp. R86511 TaxID=3093853 RepID=UPI0036D3ED12